MEGTITVEDQLVFDPNRVPKELWNLILCHLSVERKYYPVVNEIEFILPFLKLVCKRFYQAVKDYAIANKIKEKSHNLRIATMPVLAEWGALSCIKLMRGYGVRFSEGTCEMAARGGHLEVLKYARDNGCVWNVSTMYKSMSINAIMSGNVEVLQYLREHNCLISSDACDKAAKYGHLDMYKYLRSIGYGPENITAVLRAVFATGNVEFLKYLVEVEKIVNVNHRSLLYSYDCHVDCMKYLRSLGWSFQSTTCYRAAETGNYETLKYAHENGAEWTSETVKIAAAHRHFKCMKYAIENGCPMPDDICNVILGGLYWNMSNSINSSPAALNKDVLSCLKFAHEHRAQLFSTSAKLAARYDKLDCLIYVCEHGGALDESVLIEALVCQRMQCLKYLREHGCPWSTNAFVRAILQGTEEQVQYLVQEGCPLDPAVLKEELKKYSMIKLHSKQIQAKIDLLKKLGMEIDIDLKAIIKAQRLFAQVELPNFNQNGDDIIWHNNPGPFM